MINPVAAHCLGAIFITALAALGGWPWTGAAVAAAFYYSRELSQYQTAEAKRRGVTRSSLWYLLWPRGHEAEFLPPAAASLICAALSVRF